MTQLNTYLLNTINMEEASKYAQICAGMFVGNEHAALDIDFIVSEDITAIIRLTSRKPAEVEGVDYLTYSIPACELTNTELARVIYKLETIMVDLTQLMQSSRNILICCDDGRDQSVLVAGYYLIQNGGCCESVTQFLEGLYFTESERLVEVAEREHKVDYSQAYVGTAKAVCTESIRERATRNAKRCLPLAAYKKILRSVPVKLRV